MRLVVTDANIIIDLDAGKLLEDMFRLPEFEFSVPDVLYVEELADNYGVLPGLGLRVLPQSSEAVGYVEQLRAQFNGPSSNDLFALALARELNCALLTGDGALRDAAREEQIEVRGTIWLMEQLLAARVTRVDRVAVAYETMKRDGRRLPWDEASAQVQRWTEEG